MANRLSHLYYRKDHYSDPDTAGNRIGVLFERQVTGQLRDPRRKSEFANDGVRLKIKIGQTICILWNSLFLNIFVRQLL